MAVSRQQWTLIDNMLAIGEPPQEALSRVRPLYR